MGQTYTEIREEWAEKQFEGWWAEELRRQGIEAPFPGLLEARELTRRAFVAAVEKGDDADLAMLRAETTLLVMGQDGARVNAFVKIAALRSGRPFLGLGMVVNVDDYAGEAGEEAIAGACAVAYQAMEAKALDSGVEPGPKEVGEEGRPM